MTEITIAASCSAFGSGIVSSRALCRMRSMWRSMRKTCTLPSRQR